MKTQRRYNINKLALFAPNTKQKDNELLTNNLTCCAVVNDCVLVYVKFDNVKLSPFQDEVNMDVEDVCANDTPDLNILTI